MTAKEKAKELVEKYRCINYDLSDFENHKECAIIVVDEIIVDWTNYINNYILNISNETDQLVFWKEVKTELNKL